MQAFGVDLTRYGERDYEQTQRIGAAIAFLGLDGLIAPSARWRCDNLMIFQANHLPAEKLEIIGEETVNWERWAQANGFLDSALSMKMVRSSRSPPPEQPLNIRKLQFHVGRAAVVALAGPRRRLHLAQQRVHLLGLERAT